MESFVVYFLVFFMLVARQFSLSSLFSPTIDYSYVGYRNNVATFIVLSGLMAFSS